MLFVHIAIPAFGVKIDAVPGRLNETWVRITKPGVYYGQCSELCGKDHSYMPIEIRIVPQAQFDRWVLKAKEGDFDGATAIVQNIETVEETQLASTSN